MTSLFGDVHIEATSEIPGSDGMWLVNSVGEPTTEMFINPENEEEYTCEFTAAANQLFGISFNGIEVKLREFKPASEKGPDNESEYYSGTGVNADADVYLECISLSENNTRFSLSRTCTVKLYVKESGRV